MAAVLRGDSAGVAIVAGRPEAVLGARMTGRGQGGQDGPIFIKALGLWDVIFMNVVAVVGLRWIARGARAGG